MMKNLVYTLTLVTLLTNCTSGQQSKPTESKTMDDFELSPDKAHPKAKNLLTEDFYWSPIEETAPFGSDDGSDSFYGFRVWRQDNKNESPVVYLNELTREWGFPIFDLKQEDIGQIKDIDSRLLTGTDNAIIAVGFGQFVLEGRIDNEIKDLTKKAIKRELSQGLLSQYREDYIETRRTLLQKMLTVLDKM